MLYFYLAVGVIFCSGVKLCDADCGQFFDNNLGAGDSKTIVDQHNYYRNLISQGKVPGQPKGTNLKTMQWDDKLAEEAKKIAATCEMKHVKVSDDRFYVGQNLFWTGSTNDDKGTHWKDAVQSWFSEYVNFTYPSTSKGVTGHYTQVIWADTSFIGCGFSYYRKSSWYEKLYVCNYGPGGNIVGQAPYKT